MSILGDSGTHTFRIRANGGSLSWIVPEDWTLTGVNASGGFLLSTDPSETQASWFATAPTNVQTDEFYISSGSGEFQLTNLAFPLAAGTQVYCTCSTGGTVVQLLLIK